MKIEKISNGEHSEYLLWNECYSRVIGTARVVTRNGSAEIEVINIDHDYRGKNLGTKLLERVIQDFSGKELFVWTFKGRTAWYERNGFKAAEANGALVKMVRTLRLSP
jgi:N-acetylglutamate synthase-like GNAT family acetyltransferase